MRCPETTTRFDENYQCEDTEGHYSAHHNGEVWWPNKNGLPYDPVGDKPGCILIVLTAAVICALIIWLALRQ